MFQADKPISDSAYPIAEDTDTLLDALFSDPAQDHGLDHYLFELRESLHHLPDL